MAGGDQALAALLLLQHTLLIHSGAINVQNRCSPAQTGSAA